MFVSSRLMRQVGPQANFIAQNQRMIFSKFFGTTTSTNPQVYFEISQNSAPIGKITFELYMDKAPITAENFRSLCAGDGKQGYTYEGSGFHRIIDGFMAQGGDFTNHNGTGGRSIYGEKFADEPSALKTKHTKRGQLSMANAGPNTNGSQFFICFESTPWLDGAHGVFGEMVDGNDVLKTLEANGTRSGTPKAKFVIEKCGEVELAQ